MFQFREQVWQLLLLAAVQAVSREYRFISFSSVVYAKTEETESFAVGHFSLGYLFGKISSKTLRTKLNLPLVFTLSVIPDIDLLIPFLEHRGPTHSTIIMLVVFIPFFVVYRREAVPYFLALVQHPLVGDYIAGGRIQLFWPFTSQNYGIEISIWSSTNIALEWTLFVASMTVMMMSKDLFILLKSHYSNFFLSIPTFTVLLPTFLNFPLNVPVSLILPHLVYMFLFLLSIAIVFSKFLKAPSACFENEQFESNPSCNGTN